MPDRRHVPETSPEGEAEDLPLFANYSQLAGCGQDGADSDGQSRRPLAAEGGQRSHWAPAKEKRQKSASTRELLELFREQEYRCAACTCELQPDATTALDHKIPRADGGDDAIGNLQWLCGDCNRAKGTMRMSAFIAMCMRISEAHRSSVRQTGHSEAYVIGHA
jgi:hypothetical protein